MKRLLLICLCFLLAAACLPCPAGAEANPQAGTLLHRSEGYLENGLRVVSELRDISLARSTDKTGQRTEAYYDGDTVIAVITIQATFRYDGSTVSMVSKAVTQADTYGSWSYQEDSFTSSGGTVTLQGTLKWLWIFNSTPFTMTLSCDRNGNLS